MGIFDYEQIVRISDEDRVMEFKKFINVNEQIIEHECIIQKVSSRGKQISF